MNFDTLTSGGVEKSFGDWGFKLSSLQGKKRVNGEDTFSATIVNATIAAEGDAPTFPFEGQNIVRVNRSFAAGGVSPNGTLLGVSGTWSGGTVKFVGKRIGQPARASAGGQGVTYKFEGPSYDLKNTDLQQLFKGNGSSYYLPETVLNTSTAVSVGVIQISVGDQIQAALQWLLDQYAAQGMAAPFKYTGRALNSGAIDLNVNTGMAGTPGGDYSFLGWKYNFHLQSNLTIDASLYSLFLPTFIEKPMKVWQVLQKCLEMSPRINIWFDYTTVDGSGNPLPTIRFDLVDTMTAKSLALFTGFVAGGQSHKDIQITPRDDLQVRAVILKYRLTNTVSGTKVIDYVVDKWSAGGSNINLDGSGNNVTDPNCGLRVVNELVDLVGFSEQTLRGHLDVESVVATADSGGTTQAIKRAWWALKRGGELSKLEDSRVRFQDKAGSATTIPDATIVDAATGAELSTADLIANGLCDRSGNLVLNRLVRGTAHSWMVRADGQPVVTMKLKLVSKMAYAEYDATSTSGTPDTDVTGNCIKQANSSDEHVNIEVTNATPDTGASGYATFNVLASQTPGEAYIIGNGGIAQYIYNHLNARQFEGDYVMVGANFVDASDAKHVTLGNKLNLTGGASLWASINAQIVEISEDYGNHQTSVQIGIGKALSAGQLSSLFNMWRFRRGWYNTSLRVDNAVVGSGQVDMAKGTGGANTTHGLVSECQTQNLDYSTDPSGSSPGVYSGALNHDPKLITAALAAVVAGGKTPTPVSGMTAKDIKTMQPRKCLMCDEDGNQFYAMVHVSGGWTEV